MWNQKKFESVYDRYKLSGLSVKDFCINEGIYESKFFYWQKKLRDQQQESTISSSFIPIVLNSAQTPINSTTDENNPLIVKDSSCGSAIEIVYPNDVIVRLPQGTDIKELQSLIFLNQSSHV